VFTKSFTFKKQTFIKVAAILATSIVSVQVYAHAWPKRTEPLLVATKENFEPWLTADGLLDARIFILTHQIRSIDQYAQWLQENITYEADAPTSDDWASPAVTLQNKQGDCEDIAFLNAAIVRSFGYEPQVLAYGQGKEAHVICLFKMEGKYYIFDNTKYYRNIVSPSLKEIFTFLVKKHHAQYMLELSLEPKQKKILFYKG